MPHIYTTTPGGFITPKFIPSVINFEDTQGLYFKLIADHNWEVNYNLGYGANDKSDWDTRITEILAMNAGKGFQLDVPWGLYEQGASGGDFSNLRYLKTVLDECWDNGLYVSLNLVMFRNFSGSVAALPDIDHMRNLLPVDMRTQTGYVDTPTVPADASHYLWNYAYAWGGAIASGYNLKTYKPELQVRFARFARAVCDIAGNHPSVIAVSSTESAIGTPVYTGAGGFDVAEGATKRAELDGKTVIIDSVNAMFKRQMVMQSINFPNEGTGTTDPIDYAGEWVAAAPDKKYGLTGPNANWWVPALNRTATGSAPQGANRFFADFPGPRFAQIQGDELDSLVNGAPQISTEADFLQRYIDLYQRATNGDGGTKFGLEATHIIVQRSMSLPIWVGGLTSGVPNVPDGVTIPSLKDFFNNPAYVPQDGQAGLGSATVAYIT